MDKSEAISPIDGRYGEQTKPLSKIFSEKGLFSYRLVVEGEYLIFLSEHSQIGTREFSEEEKSLIRDLYDLSFEDASDIKEIEMETNHDVKAVEYFMKKKLADTSLKDSLEWIHFALTSEDVNNIAYGLMLSEGLEVVLPIIDELREYIENLAQNYKKMPMLSRTHGQPASPTTFGKEFKVFSSRLKRQIIKLKDFKILVKLNGATGNYNAHYVAYPEVDWLKFTQDFVSGFNEYRKLKLVSNFITTQIEAHDSYAELFDIMRRVNTIMIDFDKDMWRYISDDWIAQKSVDSEIGSSTMPHKVNPIDFENSEGNLGLANALFVHFSSELPISRLQRDLSDSTLERNFGVALGHSLVGYNSILKGLKKITVNEKKVTEELENHPEVISEAVQTVLRREGIEMPYEQLKALTRGKKVTMNDFRIFIDCLNIPEEIRKELGRITPTNYIGIADKLVDLN